MESQGSEPSQRRDREQSLLAGRTVSTEENAAKTLKSFTYPFVDAFHPVPGCCSRSHKGHRDSIDSNGATGSKIGEIGCHGPPTHISGAGGGIAEVNVLHENIGVHQQWPLIRGQCRCVVAELPGRSEAGEPSEQLRLAKLRQADAHA